MRIVILSALIATAISAPTLAADSNSLLKAGTSLLSSATTAETTTPAAQAGLIETLVGQLGVTEQQASGGAGALLGLAKGKMSAQDSSALSAAIPDLDKLLASAPSLTGSSTSNNLLGQASSLLGDNSSVSALSALTPAFEALGLDAGMVQQFLPIVLNFVGQQGGEGLMSAVQAALLGG